ncbi:MAG TPA: hypothetical protein VFP94_04480 [Terriglobales bacterium]|nr:hypothetical protein [Terriglobales bacterium]
MATIQSSTAAAQGSKQQLSAEHALLDCQLQQLNQKRFLSPEELLEQTRLKKLKLQLKDAMRRLPS